MGTLIGVPSTPGGLGVLICSLAGGQNLHLFSMETSAYLLISFTDTLFSETQRSPCSLLCRLSWSLGCQLLCLVLCHLQIAEGAHAPPARSLTKKPSWGTPPVTGLQLNIVPLLTNPCTQPPSQISIHLTFHRTQFRARKQGTEQFLWRQDSLSSSLIKIFYVWIERIITALAFGEQ